jgi:hypothetical protein
MNGPPDFPCPSVPDNPGNPTQEVGEKICHPFIVKLSAERKPATTPAEGNSSSKAIVAMLAIPAT